MTLHVVSCKVSFFLGDPATLSEIPVDIKDLD